MGYDDFVQTINRELGPNSPCVHKVSQVEATTSTPACKVQERGTEPSEKITGEPEPVQGSLDANPDKSGVIPPPPGALQEDLPSTHVRPPLLLKAMVHEVTPTGHIQKSPPVPMDPPPQSEIPPEDTIPSPGVQEGCPDKTLSSHLDETLPYPLSDSGSEEEDEARSIRRLFLHPSSSPVRDHDTCELIDLPVTGWSSTPDIDQSDQSIPLQERRIITRGRSQRIRGVIDQKCREGGTLSPPARNSRTRMRDTSPNQGRRVQEEDILPQERVALSPGKSVRTLGTIDQKHELEVPVRDLD